MTSTPLPLFPLNTVLFPDGVLSLQIFEVRYLGLIKHCIASNTPFGVVALTAGNEVRTPEGKETFAAIGTTAKIVESEAPMAGLLRIKCNGETRFQIESSEQLKHGLWLAQVQFLDADRSIVVPEELQDTTDALRNVIASLQSQDSVSKNMPITQPYQLDDCGWVANRWCELLPMEQEEKLRLLALDNPLLRLELVQDVLAGHGLLG
ncbi:MAG: LON peptidase substrate-binding domain-containing protein [Pseudomonadota bacterium]